LSRRVPARVLDFIYEKQVRSLAGLRREIRRLDSDAGIRVVGLYRKRPCFAFVTRFVGSYTVMVYERKEAKAPKVGKRLLSKEFDSPEELDAFLLGITSEKVHAYIY